MRNMLIGSLLFMGLFAFAQLPGNVQLANGALDNTSESLPDGGGSVLFSTFGGIQPSPFTISSQNFTDDGFNFASQGADDFSVTGNGWIIETVEVRGSYFGGAGPAESVNVYILGSTGTLPDTTNLSAGAIYAAENLAYTDVFDGDFNIVLPGGGVLLMPGDYWIVVQANMAFLVGGQWGWTESTGTEAGNESAWFQTSPGFIPSAGGPITCEDAWNARVTVCDVTDPGGTTGTDLAFQLSGQALTPGVVVDPTALVTSEAGTTATFDVYLTAPPTGGNDVSIDIGAPDASEGSVDTATVVFNAANYNIAQTVTVTGLDDALADGDVMYTLSNGPAVSGDGAYSGLAVDDVDVTNQDDESVGFTVSPTEVTVSEDGTVTATVDINLNVPLGVGESVDLPISSSNVLVATVDTANLTFTDADGTSPQTITVTGVDNDNQNGDTGFTIITGDPSSGTNAFYDALTDTDVADITGTRTDDDVAGISVTPTSGLVTTEAGGSDTFDVVLESEPFGDVTIPLSVTDDSEGTVSSMSLTFTSANWDTPQTVTVTGEDDDIDDGNVGYTVVTGAATSIDTVYAGMDASDVSVTNNDDGDTTGITVSPTSGLITTEAGGTDTFSVELDSEPTFDVTFTFTTDDATEGLVSDDGISFGNSVSLTFTPADWDTPQTVTVQGQDDAIEADGDVIFNIVGGDPTSGDANYDALTAADVDDVEVTNMDDDGAAMIIVNPTAGLVTDEDGGSDSFTVVLGTQPLGDVTITLASDNTDEGVTDVTSLTFTPANYDTAQTVTVTGQPDFIIDGDVVYNVVLDAATSSDANYNGLDPDDVEVTNLNTDVCGPIYLTATLGYTITAMGTPTCVFDLYSYVGGSYVLLASGVVMDGSGFADTGVIADPDTEYCVVPTGSDPAAVGCLGSVISVPTLGEWGLIAFVGLLAIAGMVMMRRRRLA